MSKLTGATQSLRERHIATAKPDQWFKLLPYMDPCGVVTDADRRNFRLMLKDSVVRPAFLSKVLAVASLDLSVTPEDANNGSDNWCAEFCKYATLRMNGGIVGLVEAILPPLLTDGYVLAEKVRAPLERGQYAGSWTIDRLVPKHPDLYEIKVDEYGQPTKIEGRGTARGECYEDLSDFVFATFLPMYASPTGTSDMQAAYTAYWRLDTIKKLRHSRLRNLSNGVFMLGKYGTQVSQGDLVTAIKNACAGGFGVVPDDVTIEAINISGGTNSEFETAVQSLEQEIIRCITGGVLQMMQGSTGSGSYAQSKVHQSGADLFVWHLADVLARILNTQVYPDLCELNRVGYSDYPRASFGGVSDEALAPALAIDEGLSRMGIETSRKEVLARYRRSPPADETDTFKPPAPPPSPGGAGPGAIPFSDDVRKFADIALTGKPGREAEALLTASQEAGIKTLADICETAFARVRYGAYRLFTDDERKRLTDALAATTATAHLLGQKRLRDQLAKRKGKVETFAEPEPIRPLPPVKALEYFQSLVPGIAGDPMLFGPMMQRQAFTLAVTTEETLLTAVQDVIARSLATGEGGTYDVYKLMESAGVLPTNPQYSEMVFRTNALDSYTRGYEAERTDPDVVEQFPVWRYDTAGDSRVGDDHSPMDGKYYPASASFAEVRGKRVYNCRCVPTAIAWSDWNELKRKGARVETRW